MSSRVACIVYRISHYNTHVKFLDTRYTIYDYIFI